MILQIALVLLMFFFFFLTYMVTKGWRWLHVVCLVGVFFSAIAFMFFAAFSLKNQAVWRTIVNQQEQVLAEQTKLEYELRHGPDADIPQATSSLRRARADLEQAVIDRGRVWRDCVPADVQYDQASKLLSVTLQIPPRDAAAPAAAAADPNADPNAAPPAAAANQAALRHLMSEKIILFAFLELPQDPNDPSSFKVPAYYLGEYFATAVTPTTVTLRSVVPPGNVEIQAAQSRSGTWALYEVMPSDGHMHFAEGGIDNQVLPGVLSPERTGLSQGLITQAQYDRMLQEYLRDGQPAAEDDPPERVWAKVEFLRNYEVQVDAAQPTVLATANFDSQGKALNVQLRQGDQTSFEISDEAVMDFASASDLERQGIVKIIEKTYVRELRDYEFAFHNIHTRIVELEENIRNTDRDFAKANESIGKMREQIAYREQEKAKLTEDLARLTDENTKLKAYQDRLTSFRADLSGRLSGLYQSNNGLEAELAETQANLARMIEERASRAVAEVGTGAPSP